MLRTPVPREDAAGTVQHINCIILYRIDEQAKLILFEQRRAGRVPFGSALIPGRHSVGGEAIALPGIVSIKSLPPGSFPSALRSKKIVWLRLPSSTKLPFHTFLKKACFKTTLPRARTSSVSTLNCLGDSLTSRLPSLTSGGRQEIVN